jgi:hypothetical protein
MRASALLAVFLCLFAPLAVSQTMPAHELMTAVFKEGYNPEKREAFAAMSRNGKRSTYLVQAKAAARLPSGTVVLVLSGVPATSIDSPLRSHAAGGLLSVCFMSGKALLNCSENVAELGSHGDFGEVHFISLGENRPALAITHGGTWQGYTIEQLAVFSLEDDQVHNLTREGIRLSSGNLDGGCESRSARCWDVQGAWRIDRSAADDKYRALELEFTGRFTKGPNKGTIRKGSIARYEVVAGQYKLVKGRNLVPSI